MDGAGASAGSCSGACGALQLTATRLQESLGLSQGPALFGLIGVVPTLLAYGHLEGHLPRDRQT